MLCQILVASVVENNWSCETWQLRLKVAQRSRFMQCSRAVSTHNLQFDPVIWCEFHVRLQNPLATSSQLKVSESWPCIPTERRKMTTFHSTRMTWLLSRSNRTCGGRENSMAMLVGFPSLMLNFLVELVDLPNLLQSKNLFCLFLFCPLKLPYC